MTLLLDLRDQTFADQNGFFRDKNSLHLDALDAWTRQRLPAFRLGCACPQGKCIHEICDSVPQGCRLIGTEFSVGPRKMSVMAILQQLRTL